MLEDFIREIDGSGLMSADAVREFQDSFSPDRRPTSVEQLSTLLVTHGRLTGYQVARLLEGQGAGLLLGNYVIQDLIAEGGMGQVFKGEHLRMKRPVVVKILRPLGKHTQQSIKRFQREVQAAAKLAHPNIVTAFDAGERDGLHYLVMEFVDGADLGSLVKQRGPMPVDLAVDCVTQAARGLHYAHEKGIVHRDIKPANLLLDVDATIKILDMGLARMEEVLPEEDAEAGTELTDDQQILGTVDYMSPEQADASAVVDRRSDIYSLGCTLYRLLTGRPPYHGASVVQKLVAHRTEPIPILSEIRDDVPLELDHIFAKMVAKLPAQRYATMAELIQELETLRYEQEFELSLPNTWSTRRRTTRDEDDDATRSMTLDGEATGTFDVEPVRAAGRSTPATVSDPAVGIDLGTTFSAVAVLDRENRPETLNNAEGDKITPSVLLFEDGEVIVGKEALKAVATNMADIAECAKRELGYRIFGKALDGRRYPPEALEAWILHKLATDARQQIGEFSKVVITVPAYFDEVRRKATQDAGYMAGLDVIDIINEPTAAAVAFGYQQGYLNPDGAEKPQTVLIYDLGGGTFDVTVMEIRGREFVTLATDGDMRLGGRDWDQRLVDYVAEKFIDEHQRDPRDDPNTLGRLWRECEDAKRTLSARHKTTLVCDYESRTLRLPVTRDQFEQLTGDLLERTLFTTRQTLAAAKCEWRQLDRLLLVGGSTRMPSVIAALEQLSGKTCDRSISPDEAVAHGAALHARHLLDKHEGKPPTFQITNVNSHSLGVVATDVTTGRRQNVPLIPRNTPLPAVARRVFRTHRAAQRSIVVQVVEGESTSPDETSVIGKCVVRDLPSNLAAKTPVEVRFKYEVNGRLTVDVNLPSVGKEVQHEFTRENSLTDQQLVDWRQFISQRPAPA